MRGFGDRGIARGRWSVYVLRCNDGTLYTGISTDVARRVAEHARASKGAKCLRGRGPFTVALQIELGDRALATRVERRIKRLPKSGKERLIRSRAEQHALISGDPVSSVEPPVTGGTGC
ncbi:MAG TPA: GIY-YIG nuclease family protein [Woeseiaceae bacterium]|nr:GIY-YIG nuclease family protein [Woeseiaceae bacterium]